VGVFVFLSLPELENLLRGFRGVYTGKIPNKIYDIHFLIYIFSPYKKM
jgi:hypothetical protein